MLKPREGFALALVVMLMLVVGSLAAGASMLGSTSYVMSAYKERQSLLASVVDAGTEQARARINGDTIYPQSGYRTLENGVSVTGLDGTVIPNIRRYTYVGPTGVTSGQYGVFGTIVSVAEAPNGDRVIRRLEIRQESFARFAYFTDEEGTIVFGGGDQLFGPVHSNDDITVHSTGATFNGPVTTARGISGRANGTFRQGFTERVPRIALPSTAVLSNLRGYATQGNTAFTSTNNGSAGQATMRIEFINIELNNDGDATDDDEGFIRVYTSNNAAWVTADVPSNGIRNSRNCGHFHSDGSFVSAADHPNSGSDDYLDALRSSTRRCFPGGAAELSGGFVANDGTGQYLQWPGTVDSRLNGRADAQYLFPLSRQLNPNFKGVIHVNGKVAISGTLRGRVTLAATNEVIFLDDVRYATGVGNCRDILGVFSGTDVVVADNTINAPLRPSGSGTWYTYDDTRDEFIDGIILALNEFTVENYTSGPSSAEPCGSTSWGRGCLFLNGGVIQRLRGGVGQSNGVGYLKRYSWDPCGLSDPPPYFPTTGRFARGRLLEVDPTGFDVATLFNLLTP